jgi:hypothetical protein
MESISPTGTTGPARNATLPRDETGRLMVARATAMWLESVTWLKFLAKTK